MSDPRTGSVQFEEKERDPFLLLDQYLTDVYKARKRPANEDLIDRAGNNNMTLQDNTTVQSRNRRNNNTNRQGNTTMQSRYRHYNYMREQDNTTMQSRARVRRLAQKFLLPRRRFK